MLPHWIYSSANYADLSAPEAWLLHLLAGQANEDMGGGARRGCRYGSRCIDTSKLSESSVRKYLARFERLGFIVKVGQGGGLGRANEYAIPGKPGELDHLRVDDDPRYRTAKTLREKQGNTHRGKQGIDKPKPSARRAKTLREKRVNPTPKSASHITHHLSSLDGAPTPSPAVEPLAHEKMPQQTDRIAKAISPEPDAGLLAFIERVGHTVDKRRGSEKAAAEARCRETAERLAALGCSSAKEARQRWRRLNENDIDAELDVHDLPDHWHDLAEEVVDGPYSMRMAQ